MYVFSEILLLSTLLTKDPSWQKKIKIKTKSCKKPILVVGICLKKYYTMFELQAERKCMVGDYNYSEVFLAILARCLHAFMHISCYCKIIFYS